MSENTVSRKRLRLKKKLSSKEGLFYGDSVIYILVHNAFSVLIFFGLTLSIGLFTGVMMPEGPLEAIKFYLDICFISFVAGVMGRALGIFFMHAIQKFGKVVLRSGKDYSVTQGISLLTIGVIGLVSIVGNLDVSYYIFSLLALLFLATNKFTNKALVFLVSSLISSFIWIIGMLTILQTFIFNENTFWTAMLTYFFVKLGVYIISKIIVDSRG